MAAAFAAGLVLVGAAYFYMRSDSGPPAEDIPVTLNRQRLVFDEVLGNKTNFRATITFWYCKKSGYYSKVKDIIDQIEKADPGKFRYCISCTTDEGNFEVFAYPIVDGEGIAVHSRQATKRFPQDDVQSFFALLRRALE